MHDDVLLRLHAHLSELQAIYAQLTGVRPVRPGERRASVAAAIHASEHFAAEAADLLAGTEHPNRYTA
jgi:hypothetical protein